MSETIGGPGFRLAISLGGMALGALAGAGVAQASAARILYSMGRDGQMPRFLAHVSGARKIPDRGVLLIAGITTVTGLLFSERLEQLTSLVTFGALAGFLALHVSVILYFRAGLNGGSLWRHLIAPVLGAVIIGYVLLNADPMAKLGGLVWLGLGVAVALWLRWRGRSLALQEV
nr:amino acid permease [uncultured Caulobacter sp.]